MYLYSLVYRSTALEIINVTWCWPSWQVDRLSCKQKDLPMYHTLGANNNIYMFPSESQLKRLKHTLALQYHLYLQWLTGPFLWQIFIPVLIDLKQLAMWETFRCSDFTKQTTTNNNYVLYPKKQWVRVIVAFRCLQMFR